MSKIRLAKLSILTSCNLFIVHQSKGYVKSPTLHFRIPKPLVPEASIPTTYHLCAVDGSGWHVLRSLIRDDLGEGVGALLYIQYNDPNCLTFHRFGIGNLNHRSKHAAWNHKLLLKLGEL